ncbi:MAG: MaoC family dehydratase [Synergistaceae bacterium]|jgi:3-hydroxybutyryl-CoA dehydratase|nr:MaoC family dehydratase [Synergistaceae bacterium]
MTIDEMKVGDFATFQKTLSESDVYLFAGVTGDQNPAHINEVYASGTFFKTRIVHGMLTAGLISTVLGMKLPGPGTIYMEQTLKFTAPTHIGDTVEARAEVCEILAEKNIVKLTTTCTTQDGTVVATGMATVKPPKAKKA